MALARTTAWISICPPFNSPSVPKRVRVGLATAISVAIAGSQTLAQERAPSVLASQVLPAKYLQGTGYSIGERLEIRSNRYLFRVRADYGEFTALGLPMLELRLREHLAIENARRLSRDSQILRGAIEVARQTPAGARTLLTDPIGSLRRLPLGIQANVNTIVDPLERRAGTKARRELASSIGADPETRNPVLNFYLDQLAIRKNIGRSATQTGLGFAVPGLGLLATNETIREQVRASGPRQIANDVHRRLSALGIHHQISTPFANNLQLTSTEKLLFVTHLVRDECKVGSIAPFSASGTGTARESASAIHSPCNPSTKSTGYTPARWTLHRSSCRRHRA